jgi:hypothetical protein
MTTKRVTLAIQSFVFGNFVVDSHIPDDDSYTPFVNADSRLSSYTTHGHTDGEQLRGNLLQLTDTLGDSVRCIKATIELVVDVPAEGEENRDRGHYRTTLGFLLLTGNNLSIPHSQGAQHFAGWGNNVRASAFWRLLLFRDDGGLSGDLGGSAGKAERWLAERHLCGALTATPRFTRHCNETRSFRTTPGQKTQPPHEMEAHGAGWTVKRYRNPYLLQSLNFI